MACNCMTTSRLPGAPLPLLACMFATSAAFAELSGSASVRGLLNSKAGDARCKQHLLEGSKRNHSSADMPPRHAYLIVQLMCSLLSRPRPSRPASKDFKEKCSRCWDRGDPSGNPLGSI